MTARALPSLLRTAGLSALARLGAAGLALTRRRAAPRETIGGLDIDLRAPRALGLRIGLVGFGGFFLWAAFAPLDQAVIAPGWLAVESRRTVVQHLEGGSVAAVLVADGARVAAGDPLVRLDARQAEARRAQLAVRLVAALAETARLEAELAGATTLAPPASAEGADADALARALALQQELMTTRAAERAHRQAALESRAAQALAEIEALEAQLAGRDARVALLAERLAGLESLQADGHVSRAQLAEARGEHADALAARGDVMARIAAGQERHAQARAELLGADRGWRATAAERLQALASEIAETREALAAAEDVIRRTLVTAPIGGFVQDLAVHGPGAVVAPGERLLEIVPGEDALVVEAEIRPEDIESVRRGQEVQVRLGALGFRRTLPVPGTLVEVSADRILDRRTGAAHYSAVVAFAEHEADRETLARLRPGMPAEVMIVQGRRTPLAYLLAPLTDLTARAFRD